MIDLRSENFDSVLESTSELILIDLYAEWCGPCKMIAPHLEELECEIPRIKFARINIDSEPRLAKLFKVREIPMLAFVKNNVFLDFAIGYRTKNEISELIKEMDKNEDKA